VVWLSTCSQRVPKSFLLVANRQGRLLAGDFPDMDERIGCVPESVIAIDGGAEIALQLGKRPDIIVGDMDSVDSDVLRECTASGAEIVRFAAAKDETDTQLALDLAYSRGCRSATVLMQAGGRMDHFLGLILAAYRYVDMGMDVRFIDTGFEAALLKGPTETAIHPDRKLYVSLIPLAGTAQGIDLLGMKYPLSGASLGMGETRGISNETLGTDALVRLAHGWLLVTAVSA
jgi:thiamine pyrophosphokinase